MIKNVVTTVSTVVFVQHIKLNKSRVLPGSSIFWGRGRVHKSLQKTTTAGEWYSIQAGTTEQLGV